jgi:hypothetical protein
MIVQIKLNTPLTEEKVKSLKAGDSVLITVNVNCHATRHAAVVL